MPKIKSDNDFPLEAFTCCPYCNKCQNGEYNPSGKYYCEECGCEFENKNEQKET